MLDIKIADFGINTRHAPEVVVDRPSGMITYQWARDYYLVTCFRTPFFYLTANGVEEGKPGDCVLHDPISPQKHGPLPGASEGFRNDWIHIKGADVSALIKAYNLPMRTIIPTGNSDFISSFLRNIITEKYAGHKYWKEAIAAQVNLMLLKIGRHYDLISSTSTMSPSETALQTKFVDIRMQMRQQFKQQWTVESLAKLACLSTSRFNVLYRKFFGVSPIDDLMDSRLEHAAYLLGGTMSSMNDVSRECGFSSQHYFSRVFRKRMGCTPSSFGKSGGRLPDDVEEQHVLPEESEN